MSFIYYNNISLSKKAEVINIRFDYNSNQNEAEKHSSYKWFQIAIILKFSIWVNLYWLGETVTMYPVNLNWDQSVKTVSCSCLLKALFLNVVISKFVIFEYFCYL